jgi:hypothetical protein
VNQPNQSNQPLNDKHYKNVPASSIGIVEHKEDYKHQTSYKEDFNAASEDLWIGLKYINQYKAGHLSGKFSKNGLTLSDFFDTLLLGIKEILTSELRDKKETSEHLISYFAILNNTLKLLAKEGDKLNVDAKNILIKYHGFINGYIERMLKEIKQNDKR